VFSRSARIYDAVYSWKEYGREAALVHDLVQARQPGTETLLDVACGTGAHLAELIVPEFGGIHHLPDSLQALLTFEDT
jgi:ubiquinone/menaquinone biosynthesis C-methylase UbiE